MAELRWALLALGILLIIVVYLLSQGILQRLFAPIASLRKEKPAVKPRVEPAIDDSEPFDADIAAPVAQAEASAAPADRVVTLRLIPNDKEVACDKVILALRAAGLKHGRYGIFHRLSDDRRDEPAFSVASLTEPGSFDLSNLSETKIPGMSFFMVLPGPDDPIQRFDDMVATARNLARELDAELRDDRGSSWSIQRERYVREEVIEYCLQQDKPLPDG